MDAAREQAFVEEWVARARTAAGVVFDFGGVISVSALNSSALLDYCASRGVDRAAFDAGWRNYRALWDGGFAPFDEMYRRIFADAGQALTAADVEELWKLDAEGWIRELRPETLMFMQRLKAAGKKVGILTNMSPDFHERLFVPRAAAYRALADAEVVSGLEHLYKPQPEIYALMEKRIGLAGTDLFFVDDMEPNVVAARSFGWQAEIYPAF